MSFASRTSDFFAGPWRAVVFLGVTQVLAWGAIYYTPVLMVPLIAAERGWSKAFTMGGYSLGILTAGIFARFIGSFIDRYGGHRVMPFGSLLGAAGLLALPHVESQIAYLAVWVVLGAAMSASLYDPAFATLGRIFGAAARRPITMLTLAGGLASTVSWPTTRALIDGVGWHNTYLIYAALLLFVAAPLHALMPRTRASVTPSPTPDGAPVPALLQPRGTAFALVVLAFAVYAFVPSGLLAHLLSMFGRAGIDPQTAVLLGMIFGPCQTLARLGEFTFARDVHPLTVARFAVASLLIGFALLAIFGLTTPVAIAFMLLFGISNGLITLCRGTVPLALFGAQGYGLTIGRIAGPALAIQSASPLIIAFVAERSSDLTAVALSGIAVALALVAFVLVPRPR
ncbi:major Facilitator Superfamily protein [Variibacter gotjawalensis]|uniref:Major Facilitator Superfamily protein n=1 Tax=Variibacter gotjawalensis TaxID=1333996 RepID=A0A0S3PRY2_9BRAD|nr:MFS transporter [Variibacter gotjawalensis]NIK49013.1 MFS family permease [Variibacter gotjawalensis]RZS50869.1 putative MFS family arabinose efflux permease [Variibacter gotjawalensis]BAT58703.1 major Facilitator Superfamily protein [Variibacter gotjawalensis]